MSLQWSANPIFTVKPACGDISILPKTRNYRFVLRGYHANVSVKALVDGNIIDVRNSYNVDTRSIIVELSANVTSEIMLMIDGSVLTADNGDAAVRISNLLQKAQLDINMKAVIMDIVKDANTSLKCKLFKVNVFCANGVEYNGLIEAIKEQLTLDEEYNL